MFRSFIGRGDPRLTTVFHAPKEATPSKTAKMTLPGLPNRQYLAANDWRQVLGERRGVCSPGTDSITHMWASCHVDT